MYQFLRIEHEWSFGNIEFAPSSFYYDANSVRVVVRLKTVQKYVAAAQAYRLLNRV